MTGVLLAMVNPILLLLPLVAIPPLVDRPAGAVARRSGA